MSRHPRNSNYGARRRLGFFERWRGLVELSFCSPPPPLALYFPPSSSSASLLLSPPPPPPPSPVLFHHPPPSPLIQPPPPSDRSPRQKKTISSLSPRPSSKQIPHHRGHPARVALHLQFAAPIPPSVSLVVPAPVRGIPPLPPPVGSTVLSIRGVCLVSTCEPPPARNSPTAWNGMCIC